MSELKKKVKIEDLGLKSDIEAIELVKKLKTAVTTIGYYTDGTESYIVGDFEDVSLFDSVIKQRLDNVEKKIKELNEKIESLKQHEVLELTPEQKEIMREIPTALSEVTEITEQKQHDITAVELVKTEQSEPQIIHGFTFKSQEQQTEQSKEEKEKTSFEAHKFRCPSCNNIFSVNIPKGKKLHLLTCPNCKSEVYKAHKWGVKRKISAIAIIVVALFILWLLV